MTESVISSNPYSSMQKWQCPIYNGNLNLIKCGNNHRFPDSKISSFLVSKKCAGHCHRETANEGSFKNYAYSPFKDIIQ